MPKKDSELATEMVGARVPPEFKSDLDAFCQANSLRRSTVLIEGAKLYMARFRRLNKEDDR